MNSIPRPGSFLAIAVQFLGAVTLHASAIGQASTVPVRIPEDPYRAVVERKENAPVENGHPVVVVDAAGKPIRGASVLVVDTKAVGRTRRCAVARAAAKRFPGDTEASQLALFALHGTRYVTDANGETRFARISRGAVVAIRGWTIAVASIFLRSGRDPRVIRLALRPKPGVDVVVKLDPKTFVNDPEKPVQLKLPPLGMVRVYIVDDEKRPVKKGVEAVFLQSTSASADREVYTASELKGDPATFSAVEVGMKFKNMPKLPDSLRYRVSLQAKRRPAAGWAMGFNADRRNAYLDEKCDLELWIGVPGLHLLTIYPQFGVRGRRDNRLANHLRFDVEVKEGGEGDQVFDLELDESSLEMIQEHIDAAKENEKSK
jgi:hypothetical protein